MKNLKKQKKHNFIFFLLSFVFLTSGCATSPAPEGYVAKQWATAFRELQITPIFPPREDVQVGDIYVVPVAPEDEDAIFEAKGYLPRGMWVHTLDLNKQISAFYEQRASFPQTNIERESSCSRRPGNGSKTSQRTISRSTPKPILSFWTRSTGRTRPFRNPYPPRTCGMSMASRQAMPSACALSAFPNFYPRHSHKGTCQHSCRRTRARLARRRCFLTHAV